MALTHRRSFAWPVDVPDTVVEVRFVDEQAEAKAAKRIADRRSEIEASCLHRAQRDFAWLNCDHERASGDCAACAVAWATSPQHAADAAAARAKAAAWHPLAFTIGSCWRVPVGAAFAARVGSLLMVEEWPECLTDGFVPEPPVLDLFVNGAGTESILLSPLLPDGRHSGAANVELPLDYLIEHGLRVS